MNYKDEDLLLEAWLEKWREHRQKQEYVTGGW